MCSDESNGPSSAHPFDTRSPYLTRRALDDSKLLSGNYWGELRVFLAVAKAKSYSRAAEELNVSHATVGRDIRRLQDLLGAQLVTVTTQGAHLTPKGALLASTALQLDQQLFAIAGDLKGETAHTEGVVRLGVTDGLGVVFVTPALKGLSERFPNIQVHLKSPGNLKDLRENQTDIMIGFSEVATAGVICEPLGWLHFLPVASQGYVRRFGVPTLSNLQRHRFIDSDIYSAAGGPWDDWHRLVAQGRVAHFCDASITYAMMVKADLGIGLLGNYNMMEPSAVPLDLGARVSLRLYAVAVAERLRAKHVRMVFDGVRDLFGETNPWFAADMRLKVEGTAHSEGYASLFNLR